MKITYKLCRIDRALIDENAWEKEYAHILVDNGDFDTEEEATKKIEEGYDIDDSKRYAPYDFTILKVYSPDYSVIMK